MSILMGLCLVSGCISSPETNSNFNPFADQSLDQACRTMKTNSSGWIVIDPVVDKHAGEYFLIAAKTNLAAGTDVNIQTWPITYNPVNRSDAFGSVGAGFHTHVMKGNDGENVINGVIDTRKFRPEPYFIVMFNDSANVSACTWYNVSIATEENPTTSSSRSVNESGKFMNRNSSGLWITIEPVPDICLGDNISISGTTNLPAGENITTRIFESKFHCTKCQRRSDSVDGCCGDQIPLTVTINPDKNGINTWSREVNTSQYGFRAGEFYLVDVGDPVRGIWNSTGFTVWEVQESTRPWIEIDPVPHHYLGDTITFHGTTNLQTGETIQAGVYSAEFVPCPKSTMNCKGNVTPCCGGYSSTVPVLAGACGVNRWLWDVNTAEHGFRAGGEYIISATGRNGAAEQYRIFSVSSFPQPNIILNLPENEAGGYALRFCGQANTGSGPSEELVLIVSSDSGKMVKHIVPIVADGTGYSWNFTLNKSAIVPYNFLTVSVSSKTRPEITIERTFLSTNEPVYYPYNPYSP